MPTSPEPRQRPWLPDRNKKEAHQGRAERTAEYDTSRWRNARKAYLNANPLCIECDKEGRVTPATVLDHVVQVRQGAYFWNESNWQGLCKSCHAKKSALERHGKH